MRGTPFVIVDTVGGDSERPPKGRKIGGPIFAFFDIRPENLTGVDPGLNAEDSSIFEQIEIILRSQRQAQNLGHDLFSLWVASGGYDWKEFDAEAICVSGAKIGRLSIRELARIGG